MINLKLLENELKTKASPDKAKILMRFFKTGPGEYGEGDQFWGITVPELRKISKLYGELSWEEWSILMQSPIHEKRSLALMILVKKYQKAVSESEKQICIQFYLDSIPWINNWDLVDGSAPYLLGPFLLRKPKTLLKKMVRSENLWERRIAVLACFHFIRSNEFELLIEFAQKLLKDPNDLMHKAVGWMLREMGKRDLKPLKDFLNQYASQMPRTMLRYAIERFPESQRKQYLKIQKL